MSRWPYQRLGEICSTTSGGTPSRSHPEYFGGGIPWIKSGELTDGDVTICEESITEEAIRHSSAKMFQQGTVLIAMYGATVGKLGMLGIDAATNQAVCGISTPDELDPWFLFYFLLSQREKLIEQSAGGAQPNISQKIVRDLLIPVPPFPEQRRIVDLLSRAEGIVRLRREAERKTAELIPALFLDMFGDPATNPKGWQSGKFADVVADMRNGFNPTKDQFGAGARFITVNDLYNGLTINVAAVGRVSIEKNVAAKYRLIRGDLCFVRSSVKRAGVGMASVFDSEVEAIFGGFVIRAQLNEKLLPLFACSMFHVPSIRKIVVESAGTGTITNINQPALLGVPIILPPIELQHEYISRIQQATSVQSLQSIATAKAKATFDSLLVRAFA